MGHGTAIPSEFITGINLLFHRSRAASSWATPRARLVVRFFGAKASNGPPDLVLPMLTSLCHARGRRCKTVPEDFIFNQIGRKIKPTAPAESKHSQPQDKPVQRRTREHVTATEKRLQFFLLQELVKNARAGHSIVYFVQASPCLAAWVASRSARLLDMAGI